MNEAMKQARKRYEETPVPAELNARVNLAVQRSRKREQSRRRGRNVLISLASCAAAFVLMVNVSPTFARAMEPVPVLGALVRVVTGWEYHRQDEQNVIDVRTPELQSTGNSELERRMNAEIQKRVDAIVAEAEARGRKEYEAWLDTRTEEDEFFVPVTVEVDYEVKCSTERILSFVLYMTETRASAYTECYTYNLNLVDGRDITLEDLLGSRWKEIANQTVEIGIYQRSQVEGNVFFTEEEFGKAFTSIADDQPFYINEEGNPVLVFAKYEIAPGYMGQQEFEIVL